MFPFVPASARAWQPPQRWCEQLLSGALAALGRVATRPASRKRKCERSRAHGDDEDDGLTGGESNESGEASNWGPP